MDDLTRSLMQEWIRGELGHQLPTLVKEEVAAQIALVSPAALPDVGPLVEKAVAGDLPGLVAEQLPPLVSALPGPRRGNRGLPGKEPSIAHLEARIDELVARAEARLADSANAAESRVGAAIAALHLVGGNG